MSIGATPADLQSVEPSYGRLVAILLSLVPGLRGRLLLAFIAISLFVVAAAIAGFYALYEVDRTLDRIIRKSVPVALDARELSRVSEKIVAVGPAMANASDWHEIMALSDRATAELNDTLTILFRLRQQGLDPGALDEIVDAMHQLSEHLVPMRLAGLDGITAGEQERRSISETFAAFEQFGNILRQRVADLRTQTVELRRTLTSTAMGAEQRAVLDQFEHRMIALLALDQIQRAAGNALALVSRAANALDPTEIDDLQAQARRSMWAIDDQVFSLDPAVSMELRAPIDGLRGVVIGDDSIFSWAHRAIVAKAESHRLIAEDRKISERLKVAADKLLSVSRGEIDNSTIDARAVRDVGHEILFTVAVLSLVSSFLIVWLYVGRNIVARLTGLSSGMAAIASGRRDVVVNTEGTDEVSAMGRAVEVFRQNAIERDALLIERAETAQRLEQLVEERTKELNKTVGTLKEASEVIASSIQYASRIQRSILPDSALVGSTLSDHFILWEPRDVVSGDVYWLARWGDGLLIVLGDCTGHGVPGAFVTLIANSALERALLYVDPGAVGTLISRMNQLIKSSLKQVERGGESDDGMDLGICYIPADHTRLSFAGAGISLFSAAPGEDLVETMGNKRGIGYRRVPFDQTYSETDLPVVPGMRFYMASDGLIDQIGGERHRAFGLARFLALLDRHQNQPMTNQKHLLVTALSEFQDQEIRRDDVLVLGFQLHSPSAASQVSLD